MRARVEKVDVLGWNKSYIATIFLILSNVSCYMEVHLNLMFLE